MQLWIAKRQMVDHLLKLAIRRHWVVIVQLLIMHLHLLRQQTSRLPIKSTIQRILAMITESTIEIIIDEIVAIEVGVMVIAMLVLLVIALTMASIAKMEAVGTTRGQVPMGKALGAPEAEIMGTVQTIVIVTIDAPIVGEEVDVEAVLTRAKRMRLQSKNRSDKRLFRGTLRRPSDKLKRRSETIARCL